MREIKDPVTILEYLKTPPVISGGISDLIRQIDHLQKSLPDPSLTGLSQLSRQRICGSEALKCENNLERWKLANSWTSEMVREGEPLTWASIVHLNKKLTNYSGVLREKKVFMEDREFLPPEFLTEALDEFQKRLQFEPDIFVKAFEVYLSLVTIHPFEKGNGRTALLAGDWILMSAGFLPMAFEAPLSSQMAITLDQPTKDKQTSFEKFLKAIRKSYQTLKEH